MKLHLPLFLRKAILTLMLAYGVPAVQATNLTLGTGDSLSLDFADASTIQNLNSGTLQLSGGTLLELLNCGSGNGKTYTLATGVSSLLDAEGNALTLNSANNAVSLYFDTSQPGTGFWAAGTLLLSNGALQMVLHNETVKAARLITAYQDNPAAYQYYSGLSFENISSDGAIYGSRGSTITLNNNGSVVFAGNTASSHLASACGGAIDGRTITLSNNGSVVFEGNTASASSEASGGAIYGGPITLSSNGSVVFEGNTASGSSDVSSGGAIYGDTITLSNNGSVVYEGNTASSGSSSAYGGAIYGSTTLSNNGSVEFSGNTASGRYAYGGAIDGGTITLNNNVSVVFAGNTASGRYAYGGAIDGGTITLNNNVSVVFEGNTASYGGAIYAYGNLSIQNNDSVLFEKNAEIDSGTYRLLSIYAGGSGDVISLSAAAGKTIEFRDSIYIASGSTVNLNKDYTDAAGNTHKQQGDILFTGAYAAEHLSAVKGRAGTASEILNSQTSNVYTKTKLYGGRLRVEDGAVYQGYGITAMEGSGATVRVKDATLSLSGYNLTLNSGTTLELEGKNTISGNVQMLAGSAFLFDGSEEKGLMILTGSLTLGSGVSYALDSAASWEGENHILMNVQGAITVPENQGTTSWGGAAFFLAG